jgi:hypothetical protein
VKIELQENPSCTFYAWRKAGERVGCLQSSATFGGIVVKSPFETRQRLLSCFLFFIFVSGFRYADDDDPLVVVQDGRYGYINHEGKVMIRPQFIWADDFWRGLGTVYVCGRYVSIDSSGAVHPRRIAVEGQLVPRKHDEKFGFVDAAGEFKIPPAFDDVLPFSDGLAAVRLGDKWGFIDMSGHTVIDPQFKAAYYFREGVAVAGSDSGSVLINRSGKVIAQGYNFVELVAEGRVPVSSGDGKWGYLDLTGNVAIPLVFDEALSFSGGLAAVEKNGKWGYVDHDGKIVIPLHFDHAGQFASGLAPAKLGKNSGFIDRSGKFAFFLAFDQATGFVQADKESGLLTATGVVSRFWTDDNRFGYVNTSGRIIWGPAKGDPEHRPLFDWSEAERTRSCEGIPKRTRNRVAAFPDH